jgi:hypothetical protein
MKKDSKRKARRKERREEVFGFLELASMRYRFSFPENT